MNATLSNSTFSARTVGPWVVNHDAMHQYASATPKAIVSKYISKSERFFLSQLGADTVGEFNWATFITCRRFPVLGTSSAKTEKGELIGYLTGICYLSPASESEFVNVCAWAGNCKAICLNTAGRGAQNTVQKSRKMKTFRLFNYSPEAFLLNAILDLRTILKKAKREGYEVAVRLDGTSDLGLVNYPLESLGNQTIAQLFPQVSFYEYTKSVARMGAFLSGEFLPNVSFTFSYDGKRNEAQSLAILKRGGNVAVCFKGAFPAEFLGAPVVDGDSSDLRFLDPKGGVIIGLKAKGKAKKMENGFVVTT